MAINMDNKGLNKGAELFPDKGWEGINHLNKQHNQKNRLKKLLDRLLNPVVLRLELALPMLLVLLSLGKLPLPWLLVVLGLYLETMKALIDRVKFGCTRLLVVLA